MHLKQGEMLIVKKLSSFCCCTTCTQNDMHKQCAHVSFCQDKTHFLVIFVNIVTETQEQA